MPQDQLRLFGIEIGRGDLLGQGGLEQLLGAVFSDALGFQVGAEAADAHHAGQALQLNGAGHTGVDIALPLLHLGFQALFSLKEALQVRQPLHLTVGNLIEGVLHPGRETGVHQIREVLLQQGRHGKSREAGGERVVGEGGVAAIDDRADDRGIGGRPADALLLEHLHQGRLAVASGGLGLVTEGLHRLAGRAIAHLQGRQQQLLSFNRRVGIVAALDVGAKETSEVDALTRGPELGWAQGAAIGLQFHREHGEAGISHLAGHGALPDQLIEGQILAI